MFQVNVAPDMGMYSLLRSQGYDPAYALAEFIDNAIHAYQTQCSERIEKGDPLKVTLNFYSSDHRGATNLQNCIIIDDDGPGIAGAHLGEALKPAKHSGMSGLSEFGIGMKAAAVWFADTWSLLTCPVAESKKYEFTFDLSALLATGSDILDVIDSPDEITPKGTKLTLTGLRKAVDDEKYKEICAILKELYQRFTAGESPRMKLIARFNETPTDLQYMPPTDRLVLDSPMYKTVAKILYAIGPSQTWTVPVSTIFNGYKVEGFISLLVTGSYVTNPGIILFRNERVICGTTKQPYIPKRLIGTSNKFARQRVYGELHMDEMPVTYTKDKFEFNEDAFIDQLLSDQAISGLIRQAEAHRISKKEGEPIIVSTEAEIHSKSGTPGKPKPAATGGKSTTTSGGGTSGGTSAPSTSPSTTAATPAQPPVPDLVMLLTSLKEKTSSLMLRSFIAETIYQYQWRHEISAALGFRVVLELGVLFRIERDFAAEYPKVADKGIKAVITYLNANRTAFFDAKVDHRVIKSVQSITDGTQPDVILLNNIAHSHYQPSRAELNRFAINMEQLLLWAYS
ncbi:MAG TPA: ATP-binding protein [Halothiobacillus sp.]|nr:ATP-binding protein [Halothiobacillus sp.]